MYLNKAELARLKAGVDKATDTMGDHERFKVEVQGGYVSVGISDGSAIRDEEFPGLRRAWEPEDVWP